MALGAEVLAQHPSGEALRGPAAAFRAETFPSPTRTASRKPAAGITFSSWVSLLATQACMPPWGWRQRW